MRVNAGIVRGPRDSGRPPASPPRATGPVRNVEVAAVGAVAVAEDVVDGVTMEPIAFVETIHPARRATPRRSRLTNDATTTARGILAKTASATNNRDTGTTGGIAVAVTTPPGMSSVAGRARVVT